MKILAIIGISFSFQMNSAFSETHLQAQTRVFRGLYNDRLPGGRYDRFGACTGNAITFVLEDLVDNQVPFDHGYIVSFRSYGYIHYFQSARSDGKNFDGKKSVWSKGTPFYLANYYNHTFIVLNGRVFDFSIRDGRIQKLSTYLRKSFLPPVGQFVDSCGLDPEFNETSLIAELSSPITAMDIYRLDSVSKTTYPLDRIPEPRYVLGQPSYSGRPIDIFIANGVVSLSELPSRQRNAAEKRAKKLSELKKSGEFDRRNYIVSHTRCLQAFGRATASKFR